MKIKRIFMSVLGVVICGISVGAVKHAALGVDPFQSMMCGLDAVIPIRFGTLYVIVNLLLLLFALRFDTRKIGLGTMVNLFFLGYITAFSQACCAALFPAPSLAVRFALLGAGIVVICLSSAFYYTADLGVSTYDAIALIWSEKQSRLRFRSCRMICDLGCVALGTLLCLAGGVKLTGVVGTGTVITAFFMGPLVEFFDRSLARPFLYGRRRKG